MRVETEGAGERVTVDVHLGGLDAEAVRVELYADAIDDGEPERHAMEMIGKLDEPDHGYEYSVAIPARRELGDYTPRLLPRHPIAAIPLEAHEILWQR
jgi:starch phosphorylase